MLWDETEKTTEFVMSDDVVDLIYKIKCKQIPTTHAKELAQALFDALPWIKDEPEFGIHQIHGATSANGWERPADGELIHLSKRSKMSLRVPKSRVEDAQKLSGKVLDVAGCEIEVGVATKRMLNPLQTIFARYVAVPDGLDENEFIQWVAAELKLRNIHIQKLLCGMLHKVTTDDQQIETRSVMIADLDKQSSAALLERGVGPYRLYGCGIFMPQKGIKAVGETEDKSHFTGT